MKFFGFVLLCLVDVSPADVKRREQYSSVSVRTSVNIVCQYVTTMLVLTTSLSLFYFDSTLNEYEVLSVNRKRKFNINLFLYGHSLYRKTRIIINVT